MSSEALLTAPAVNCLRTSATLSRLASSARLAAVTARPSDWSARRASATFWSAVSTVARYWAWAWVRVSSAARWRRKRVPASNSGWATAPATLHRPAAGLSSPAKVVALAPPAAERVNCGSRLARAMPTWAPAACTAASAALTSGRWATRREGRLTGRLRGRRRPARVKVWPISSLGTRPASAVSRLRCCASARCRGGSVCCDWARRAVCWTTSAPASWPAWDWVVMSFRRSVWAAITFSVAAIWPRRDASWIAAATTLPVSVSTAASYCQPWIAVWASAASIARRVPPNTSGT